MAKMGYTRTVNPLQFEALEPKRFEDLVRQLLYDFKPWQQLEATGRSGSDDGFDARGWEVISSDAREPSEDSEDEVAPPDQVRLWLVQCKRERAIGPKKLVEYLEGIPTAERPQLFGIVIAAPADFSKRTRDAFRGWCGSSGISECHLWGKAELEDALFQPRNDHLLFAYFGLSLTIRRRSVQARLRSRTTTKRKLKRVLADKHYVLVRDIEDNAYPYHEKGDDQFRWWVFQRPTLTFRGLQCTIRRHFAFIDDDQVHWDYANAIDDNRLSSHEDPWRGRSKGNREDRHELYTFWSDIPKQNQAWLEVIGVIELDDILEVDEVGDELTDHPHVYVRTNPATREPFAYRFPDLETTDRWSRIAAHPDPSNRIARFPAKFRKPMPGQNADESEEN